MNILLEFLKSAASVKEKQRRLDEVIDRRVAQKKVRYYEEPALVFDD